MDCIVVHSTLAAPRQLPEDLFQKCTCLPPHPPTRTRSARVGRFRYLPSPNGHKNMHQRLADEGFTSISFTVEGKKAQSFTRKTQVISALRVKIKSKGGIANSLSARCAGACPFARTEVRMRKQWVTRWAEERAPFQKKRGGRREKKGRFVRNSTSFYSASPHSRKTKCFSHKIFDYSKLNPHFCA